MVNILSSMSSKSVQLYPFLPLCQSTAIDVMAIGLADGQVILHNLALDKTVMKFKQDYGPVTKIGFRSGKPYCRFKK